jgi:MtN3 and saliva related transmembrane protein
LILNRGNNPIDITGKMKDYTIYVGIGAGVLTSISMLPQLIKIIKEKRAENISFVMLFILLAGIMGWVLYGMLKKDYPIIATNSFSFLVNALVIIFSIIYKNKAS